MVLQKSILLKRFNNQANITNLINKLTIKFIKPIGSGSKLMSEIKVLNIYILFSSIYMIISILKKFIYFHLFSIN